VETTYDATYAPGYAGEDPTKAIWRRIFAYAIDGALVSLIAGAVFFALADFDQTDVKDCPDNLPSGLLCIDPQPDDEGAGDDDVITMKDDGIWAAIGVGLAVTLLNNVVLQGRTGASIGKVITACRVVTPEGSIPGIGRAFIRWILLIIDGINLILPLGLWVAMFSRGHRRIGDMAAGTYVVKSRYAGQPLPAYVTGARPY
jgi:uncharacterized RDD family membrane protein YckC